METDALKGGKKLTHLSYAVVAPHATERERESSNSSSRNWWPFKRIGGCACEVRGNGED